MQFKGNGNGYTMKLSAWDIQQWVTCPTAAWPCSTLRGNRLVVDVDDNGLLDMTVNGTHYADIDGNELDAIISDHLPESHRHLWPVWGEVVK